MNDKKRDILTLSTNKLKSNQKVHPEKQHQQNHANTFYEKFKSLNLLRREIIRLFVHVYVCVCVFFEAEIAQKAIIYSYLRCFPSDPKCLRKANEPNKI